jgi:hypothetical protein
MLWLIVLMLPEECLQIAVGMLLGCGYLLGIGLGQIPG